MSFSGGQGCSLFSALYVCAEGLSPLTNLPITIGITEDSAGLNGKVRWTLIDVPNGVLCREPQSYPRRPSGVGRIMILAPGCRSIELNPALPSKDSSRVNHAEFAAQPRINTQRVPSTSGFNHKIRQRLFKSREPLLLDTVPPNQRLIENAPQMIATVKTVTRTPLKIVAFVLECLGHLRIP